MSLIISIPSRKTKKKRRRKTSSFNLVMTMLLITLLSFEAKSMILDRDPTEDLKKAFKLFAEDSSGKISFRNLRKIAKYVYLISIIIIINKQI